MDVNTFKEKVKDLENFYDIKEYLIPLLDKLKDINKDDFLDFQKLLGQLAVYNLKTGDESKLEQMELIYRYQYNQVSNFEKNLISMLYSSSSDNISKLEICYPMEVKAFNKYGRENATYLGMEIKELKNKINNNKTGK